MKSRTQFTLLKVTALLGGTVLMLGLVGCGRDNDAQGQRQLPAPPVTVVEVQPESLDYLGKYAGRVRGIREVEVRARVGGIIEERLYNEGQLVESGTPLFGIEQEPYKIALLQADANFAAAQANANQAEREWNRVSGLFDRNAVSERDRDRALSTHELTQAQLKLAEATRAEAQLHLDYTTVVAPISGPTGLESISEGSLIERGTLLSTIVQSDPVQVHFALPENDAHIQRTARPEPSGDHQIEAELILVDGSTYHSKGVIDFTDSTIDARTGSVQARALFDNPDGDLVPGQFVRLRVSLQQFDNVFLIDPAAVGEGLEGRRVFILKSDDTVESRNVRIGPVVDGKQVILDGLEPGDRIVINGHVSLQSGMPVNPQVL